jgi:hypothetical protein
MLWPMGFLLACYKLATANSPPYHVRDYCSSSPVVLPTPTTYCCSFYKMNLLLHQCYIDSDELQLCFQFLAATILLRHLLILGFLTYLFLVRYAYFPFGVFFHSPLFS